MSRAEYKCVGCGKVGKFGSRNEAVIMGWRLRRYGNGPIVAQCGCMTMQQFSEYQTEAEANIDRRLEGGR